MTLNEIEYKIKQDAYPYEIKERQENGEAVFSVRIRNKEYEIARLSNRVHTYFSYMCWYRIKLRLKRVISTHGLPETVLKEGGK